MGNQFEKLIKGTSDEKAVDDNLSKFLDKANRHEQDKLKLLMLGSGDSGKTTIVKQMHILYGSGISESARRAAKKPLFSQLLQGAKATVEACGNVPGSAPLQKGSSLEAAQIVREFSPEDLNTLALPQVLADAIATLWDDPEIRNTWDSRSNYQVLDCWSDFANCCQMYPEWGGHEWLPTLKEYLFTRIRTSGVVQELFRVDGVTFQLVDVGGQRSERRKWIHCFEGVTAVLFVAAISEYDQFLFEDQKKNRLAEALDLFGSIANSQWFRKTTMLLFLNKADIFEEKLVERQIPLNKTGLFQRAPSSFDYDEGVRWMTKEFLLRNRDQTKIIFPHVTTAVDTDTTKIVLDSCKKAILKQALDRMNFYP